MQDNMVSLSQTEIGFHRHEFITYKLKDNGQLSSNAKDEIHSKDMTDNETMDAILKHILLYNPTSTLILTFRQSTPAQNWTDVQSVQQSGPNTLGRVRVQGYGKNRGHRRSQPLA